MKAVPFLLEIGTEELPVRDQTELARQLLSQAELLFKRERLTCPGLEAWATPRRLTVFVDQLATRQRPQIEKILGPSRQTAFTAQGHPTSACVGFLKRHGASFSQLTIEQTPKGEVVAIHQSHPGQSALAVLRTLIPQLVSSLQAPRLMRWGSPVRFPRPIRTVVALLGRQVVPCQIGSLKAGRVSLVWRAGGAHPISISSAHHYPALLKRHGILVSSEARRKVIQRQLTSCAKRLGGAVEWGHGLLDEVTNLVERPYVIHGSIDPSFLQLPREVILASLSKYQRVFAVSRRGRLLPRFLAVLNGPPTNLDQVRRHYGEVLAARLKDAQYFFLQDVKHPLAQRQEALQGMMFITGFGTLYEKGERIIHLTREVAQAWQTDEATLQHALRAARLCKNDLTTQMVKEFPSLQGTMGRIYALRDREPAPAAQAIEQHYWPRAGDAMIPKTLAAQCVAVADKLDSVVICFLAQLIPTGSEDPYGVKRQADGLIHTLVEARRHLALDGLIPFVIQQVTTQFPASRGRAEETGKALRACLRDRLRVSLINRGFRHDLVEAVLVVAPLDPAEVSLRVEQLSKIFNTRGFYQAARVVERTTNILRPVKEPVNKVNPELLREPLEQSLWAHYQATRPTVERLAEEGHYAEATLRYGTGLHDVVHEFFDQVLVNVDEAQIRQNRLAVMKAINRLYTERIADLALLQIKLK